MASLRRIWSQDVQCSVSSSITITRDRQIVNAMQEEQKGVDLPFGNFLDVIELPAKDENRLVSILVCKLLQYRMCLTILAWVYLTEVLWHSFNRQSDLLTDTPSFTLKFWHLSCSPTPPPFVNYASHQRRFAPQMWCTCTHENVWNPSIL